MKKLLLVMAVAGFVACNNSGTSEKTTTDSVKSVVDTAKAATTATDSTKAKDSLAKPAADSTKK